MNMILSGLGDVWEAFLDWWFGPKDVLPLRWFESFLVGSMLYYFYGYLQTPEWWLTDTGFHISAAATSRGPIQFPDFNRGC